MVFGLPMVDLGAGEHAYGLVMKSLYQRAVTGEGARLDISMFQSAVSWMVSPVMLSNSFNIPVTRHGNTHQFFAPVSVFATAIGRANVVVATGGLGPTADDLTREVLAQVVGRELVPQYPAVFVDHQQ